MTAAGAFFVSKKGLYQHLRSTATHRQRPFSHFAALSLSFGALLLIDLIVPAGQLCKDFALQKVRKLVVGGATRTQSVLAGVRETDPAADVIGVHDGARPFVTPEVLEQVILRAAECGAAAPAVPVHDTIKRAAGGLVEETLNREELFAVQTPQVFEPSLIKAALQKAAEEGAALTDDCAAVERLGMTVCLTRGSDENIKITTPADLNLGLGILNGRGELV